MMPSYTLTVNLGTIQLKCNRCIQGTVLTTVYEATIGDNDFDDYARAAMRHDMERHQTS